MANEYDGLIWDAIAKLIKEDEGLLQKDSSGLIEWESWIDKLATDIYIDNNKDSNSPNDNWENGYGRPILLNANATGTKPKDYLDPIPYYNKQGEGYRDARHDEIKMNVDNMDYTNKNPHGDEDIVNGNQLDKGVTWEELAKAFDLCGDGVIGYDDAFEILTMYAVPQSGGDKIALFDSFQNTQYSNAYPQGTNPENSTIYLTEEQIKKMCEAFSEDEKDKKYAKITEKDWFNRGHNYDNVKDRDFSHVVTDNNKYYYVNHVGSFLDRGTDEENKDSENSDESTSGGTGSGSSGTTTPPTTTPTPSTPVAASEDSKEENDSDSENGKEKEKYINEFATLFSTSEEYKNDMTAEQLNAIWVSKYNTIKKVHPSIESITSEISTIILVAIRIINEKNETDYDYITYEQFIEYFQPEENLTFTRASNILRTGFLNLLMPRYARRVEVEDLDKNFWVIGQVLDAIVEALWRKGGIVDAIRMIINQLNYLTDQVNIINSLLGLNGDTSVAIHNTDGDEMTYAAGIDLTHFQVTITKGSGVRTIKVPIDTKKTFPSTLSKEEIEKITTWKSLVKALNKAPKRPTSLGYMFLFQSDAEKEAKNGDGDGEKTKNPLLGAPFITSLVDNADKYIETVERDNPFIFVSGINILLFNQNYYTYTTDDEKNTITITEKEPTNKNTKEKKNYSYKIEEVLVFHSNQIVENELVMINFSPNKKEAVAVTNESSFPWNFDTMDLQLVLSPKTDYRTSPKVGLRNVKIAYNRDIGAEINSDSNVKSYVWNTLLKGITRQCAVGVQYYNPPVIDFNNNEVRKKVDAKGITYLHEFLQRSQTGISDEIDTTISVPIFNGTSFSSVTKNIGEQGLSSNFAYVVCGTNTTSYNNMKNHMHNLITEEGIGLSEIGQRAYYKENGSSQSNNKNNDKEKTYNLVTKNSKQLYLKNWKEPVDSQISSTLNGNFYKKVKPIAQSMYGAEKDKKSYITGWVGKEAMKLDDIFDFSDFLNENGETDGNGNGNKETKMQEYLKTIKSAGDIRDFVQKLGLLYNNVCAAAFYPEPVVSAIAPFVPTHMITGGDGNNSINRHCSQFVLVPICYDDSTNNNGNKDKSKGARNYYKILHENCAFYEVDWVAAEANKHIEPKSQRSFLMKNIDWYWKGVTDVIIGQIIICVNGLYNNNYAKYADIRNFRLFCKGDSGNSLWKQGTKKEEKEATETQPNDSENKPTIIRFDGFDVFTDEKESGIRTEDGGEEQTGGKYNYKWHYTNGQLSSMYEEFNGKQKDFTKFYTEGGIQHSPNESST